MATIDSDLIPSILRWAPRFELAGDLPVLAAAIVVGDARDCMAGSHFIESPLLACPPFLSDASSMADRQDQEGFLSGLSRCLGA
eukprot:CAMPEP_0203938382 /NCGR_PEP_ID=MMETSP0359-20131031/75425_1 /ASSEMBLY_ACC=CAM_ASM_000338 /TAXON_ID=268821 /ORGANISM="Scrippsiella Hangoei, Strain SHTV-5" /LENGTH=83 /DNA_ID=CAMNT_0050868585 /DNA_START=361 /DNA_END=608 /DNA_ORIENTATION=-